MKTAVLGTVLALALAAPAHAQNTNTNTVTNTVNVGKPAAVTPAVQAPKPQAPKPAAQPKPMTAKPPVKAATPAPTTAVNSPSAKSTATASNAVALDSRVSGSSTSNAAGGAGGAGGSAAGGNAVATAGDVTVNNVSKGKRPVASAVAPPIYANSACDRVGSAAVQTGGLGVSLGLSSENVQCETRQDVTMFMATGKERAALARACMGDVKQRVAIEAEEGVDCTELTKGYVPPRTARATADDMTAFCQEPLGGDYERWADRQRICQ